jgi:hypothetical protein
MQSDWCEPVQIGQFCIEPPNWFYELGLVRFSRIASRSVAVPGLDQVDLGVTLKPGQIQPSSGFKTGIKKQCVRLFKN